MLPNSQKVNIKLVWVKISDQNPVTFMIPTTILYDSIIIVQLLDAVDAHYKVLWSFKTQ